MPLKNYTLILTLALAVMFGYYMINGVLPEKGGDFFLRLAESHYFTLGINPYDIYTKAIPPMANIGQPNVYSFVSYIFLSPLTLLPANTAAVTVFVLMDLASFVLVARVLKTEGLSHHLSFPVTFGVMMLSVFFIQHVWVLNYNVIVSSCLFIALWANRRGDWPVFLLAGFLVGLKPTVFIPFFILLLARGSFSRALTLAGTCAVALLLSGLHMDVSMLDYVKQLVSTAEGWSDVSNNGVLSLLIMFGVSANVIYSIVGAGVFIFAVAFRTKGDLISDFGLCVLGSLMFFYNHVHAWVMVYPLLVVWVALYFRKESVLWPGLFLILFLIVPRLMSQYPEGAREWLIVGHNALRFGILAAVVGYYFVRAGRCTSQTDSTRCS
jgi:hypothetical protein